MTVGELEQRMSSRELVEWGAYDKIRAIEGAHQAAHQETLRKRSR